MSRKADMYRELGCNLRTECKQVKVICKGVIFPENFWMEQLVVTHFVTCTGPSEKWLQEGGGQSGTPRIF